MPDEVPGPWLVIHLPGGGEERVVKHCDTQGEAFAWVAREGIRPAWIVELVQAVRVP